MDDIYGNSWRNASHIANSRLLIVEMPLQSDVYDSLQRFTGMHGATGAGRTRLRRTVIIDAVEVSAVV